MAMVNTARVASVQSHTDMQTWKAASTRRKWYYRRASMVVSGIELSSIVVTMSTKGTPISTALTRSGRMVTTAPIVRPPADRPSAHSLQHSHDAISKMPELRWTPDHRQHTTRITRIAGNCSTRRHSGQ